MDTLTTSDVFDLHAIVLAAARNKRVGRLIDGTAYRGTARHLSTPDGLMVPIGSDVRDAYVRVTLDTSGAETYWPVRDLMREIEDGTFLVFD